MEDFATRVLQRHQELVSDAASESDKRRKLVRYVLPQEASLWGVNPDGPAHSPTVDDTARECLDNLVAGLDEMLFRREPYEVVPRDDRVTERGGYEVEWSDYATHQLNVAIDHPRSGWISGRQTTVRSTHVPRLTSHVSLSTC